jgi:hypothetical protein
MRKLKVLFIVLIGILAALSCAPGETFAQARVALVIGNGAYRNVPPLLNPANDAADIAGALSRLGFTVSRLENAGFDTMRRALVEFGHRAHGADIAVVFFAGHGMEVGGENWLLPVDAELRSDINAENETIGLRNLVLTVSGASKLGLVILDACRNNPFAARMQRTMRLRAVDRGLARIEPTGSVLVAYAARDGTTAADGITRNSPFTAALLRHIETPGLEINFLFRNVRDDVLTATGRQQEPYVYGSLSREAIYLRAALTSPSPDAPLRPTPMPAPAPEAIAAPHEPLPTELPVDPEVLRMVETHSFFAKVPPVLVGAYNVVSNTSSTTSGSSTRTASSSSHDTSVKVRWLRSGVVKLDQAEQYTVNNAGAVGRYANRSTTLGAGNGLFNLSYRIVFTSGRTSHTTTTQLVRIENMRGRIFPIAVGNTLSYDLVYRWKSSTAAGSESNSKSSCEIAKRYDARVFNEKLTGLAYLLTCNTETTDKNGVSRSQSRDLFFDALGIWLRVDPISPRERLVMNNETVVSGGYTTVTNGTYTLKSFVLAR